MLVRVIKLPIKLIVLSLLTLVGLFAMASTTHAATYTVTNTADSGAGSLRQAITDANANGGADTIEFNIAGAGPHTITVGATELPEITGPTIVDGTTQSGTTCGDLVPATLPSASNTPHNIQIVLDGSNITWIDYEQGILHFINGADNSEVRGISFVNGGSAGPVYISGISVGDLGSGPVSDVLIECNYFGIMPDGTTEAPNIGSAIQARYEVSGIVVRNNLLTGWGGLSIFDNNFPYTSTGNLVEENLFGTLADGLTPASFNQSLLNVEGVTGVTIQRNVIGADGNFYAAEVRYSENAIIQNNYIGLNINQGALTNFGYGLSLTEADNSTTTNNLIANNGFAGITAYSYNATTSITNNDIFNNQGNGAQVGSLTVLSGNNIHDNDSDGVVLSNDGSVTNNYIYSNGGDGVAVGFGFSANVQGNYIGINQSLSPSGNGSSGISISDNSFDSTIGGALTSERNYIADNVNDGIRITNDIAGSCARSNIGSIVAGNYVGVNTSGVVQSGFGNGGSGVSINEINTGDQCGGGSVYNHQIGGDAAGEQNIIAGNNEDGIRIFMPSNQATGANVFSGIFLPNSIFGNGNLGVNLAYDSDGDGTADTDLGPNTINAFLMSYPATNANYYLNRPTINNATFSSNDITVNYDFQANGVQEGNDLYETDLVGYRLDFYLNDAGQDGAYAGYSQGKTHIGSFIVNGSETNASHVFTSPVTPTAGQVVTATATVLWINREAINCGPPTYYGPPYGPTCM